MTFEPTDSRQEPASPLAGESSNAEYYRRQLETVCNNATLALFIMDEQQQCVYMNRAAEQLTGFTFAEVQGRPLHEVIHHTRPDGTPYPLEECPIDQAFPQNNQEQGEEVFVHKNGSFYHVAYTASPIREAGVIVGTIIEVRDITQEKAAERAREELDRAKTSFFSNVSHELRTPLTLMLGPIEDALADVEEPLGPRQRERMLMLQRNTTRLLTLVNTLLDFSRIEAGRAQAVYMPTDLASLTADLAGLFRSSVERAGLRFTVECPPLPKPVYVDRDMWEKIVTNLLSNALKFTFEGEIAVALRWGVDHVVLTVGDTGAGIPSEELPKLFERFHRVPGARGRTHEGTGIGLALVHELVRLHRGTIDVQSSVGVGSIFTVQIPTGSAHLPPERVLEPREDPGTTRRMQLYAEEARRWLPDTSPSPGQADALAARLQPDSSQPDAPRILLADDNADMRTYIQRILSPACVVRAVEDGLSALSLAQEWVPDLALVDVMMPGLDGFELLRELRGDMRTREIPVVMLSARAGEEARIEGLHAGATDYLVKPFSARELLARIHTILELAQLRREAVNRTQAQIARLQQLAEASLAINAQLALPEMLQTITEYSRAIIGAHQAITSLTTDEGWSQAITALSLSDKYAAWRSYTMPPSGGGIYKLVCQTNRPIRMTQAELEAHPAWRGFGSEAGKHPPMRGWLATPLARADGHNLGLIQLSDKQQGEFTAEDEAILMQLAQLASVAIENARLYQAAQDAIRLRNEFLTVAAHELKTPMTSLRGFTQLLLRQFRDGQEPDPERVSRALLRIDEQSDKLSRLIEQLLDIGRIESSRLILDRRPTDMTKLVQHVVMMFQAMTDQHTISVQSPETIIVQVDPLRMEQVLTNLLGNAVKYSPRGGPIDVVVSRQSADGLCVSVTDAGIGIPPEHRAHIFDPFYQAHYAEHLGGMGMGLYISQQIVALHGGRIEVEFPPDGGTRFLVQLPINTDTTDAPRLNQRA